MIKINSDDTPSSDVLPSDQELSLAGRARPPPGGPAIVPLQAFQDRARYSIAPRFQLIHPNSTP